MIEGVLEVEELDIEGVKSPREKLEGVIDGL